MFHHYRLLLSHKMTVVVEQAYMVELLPKLQVVSTNDVDLKRINVIITIGGDGTILWANKYFKYGGIPPIIAFAMARFICHSAGNSELSLQFCD